MVSIENLTNPLLLYAPADPRKSEEDTAEMLLIDSGVTISSWKSYDFSTDWTDANSSWSFELADESYQRLLALGTAVQNGAKVALKINGAVQATGYVDQITLKTSRGGGTTMTITGRDALSPACDTSVNPNFKWSGLSTLGDLIRKVFEPFGFKAILVDDSLNRTKLATSVTLPSTTTFSGPQGKMIVVKGATVDVAVNSKFKPHTGEGCYEFAERISKRFGFHIICSNDGTNLFAVSPDNDSAPFYSLTHKTDGSLPNNIISSDVTYDWHQQPSVIIAEGHGGGGHFNKKIARVLMVNELLSDNDDQVPLIQQLKKDFPAAKVLKRRSYLKRPPQVKVVTKFAKPLFLYDDESKELKHLENYTRRIMAEHQSKFMTAHYTVNRHSYNGTIWTPNTSVTVNDDISGINQTLWIKSRKFTKDRTGGTKTELVCILPHTYELFNEDK